MYHKHIKKNKIKNAKQSDNFERYGFGKDYFHKIILKCSRGLWRAVFFL